MRYTSYYEDIEFAVQRATGKHEGLATELDAMGTEIANSIQLIEVAEQLTAKTTGHRIRLENGMRVREFVVSQTDSANLPSQFESIELRYYKGRHWDLKNKPVAVIVSARMISGAHRSSFGEQLGFIGDITSRSSETWAYTTSYKPLTEATPRLTTLISILCSSFEENS